MTAAHVISAQVKQAAQAGEIVIQGAADTSHCTHNYTHTHTHTQLRTHSIGTKTNRQQTVKWEDKKAIVSFPPPPHPHYWVGFGVTPPRYFEGGKFKKIGFGTIMEGWLGISPDQGLGTAENRV